jgi:hypothetical protein
MRNYFLSTLKKLTNNLKLIKMTTKHYKINDQIFIDYMDAYEYCIKNKISTELIIKTNEY